MEDRKKRPKITDTSLVSQKIKQILNQKRGTYLREYKDELMRAFRINVSQASIYIYFRRHRITWKKVCKVARSARVENVNQFWTNIKKYAIKYDQIVFLDETYISNTIGNRNYGRSLRYFLFF